MFWASVACFLAASATALDGESKLIDHYSEGASLHPKLKRYRVVAIGFFGVGMAMLYGAWTL